MKALILDGSSSGDEVARRVTSIVSETLRGEGVEVENVELERMDLKHCAGCFGCWMVSPGICVIDDDGRHLAMQMVRSDLLVCVTPITFGGYSYHLKKAVDRLTPNIHPFFTRVEGEVHHRKRYDTYPRLVAIGISDGDDESEGIFRRLVARNAINLHSPSFSTVVLSRLDVGEMEAAVLDSLRAVGAVG